MGKGLSQNELETVLCYFGAIPAWQWAFRLMTSLAITGDLQNNSSANVYMGYASGSGYLNGAMDTMVLYNRALSVSEVQALYTATK